MIFEKNIVESYKQLAFQRCDGDGTAFYYSARDFEGLFCTPYNFASSKGHNLKGYFYCYKNPICNRIIVFDHGMGGGHRSYMKEIERLCSRGYLVFAYDHTGCMESEGESTGGMAQSLCDLNDCLNALKSDENYADYSYSAVGHSWGGFSVLNISALHPDVTHIVAMCGFISVEALVNSYFDGLLKPYREAIMKIEGEANPDFIKYNALKTLSTGNTKALLIYSDDDMLCKKKYHYDALYSGLCERENVSFILKHNRGHNPNYTENAVLLLSDCIEKKNKLLKSKQTVGDQEKKAFRESFDWNAMTEQDEDVWNAIYAHLERPEDPRSPLGI